MRNKANFDLETTNLQADMLPTKCEIWLRKVNFMIPGFNTDTGGESNILLAITTQAGCIYDKRKCARMLTLVVLSRQLLGMAFLGWKADSADSAC
eukprot:1153601-Pelagomonas_calceolata.AAC.2